MSSKCSLYISQESSTYFVVFLISFMLCTLIPSIYSESYELPVCCPPGWELVQNNAVVFTPNKYECTKREVAEKHSSNSSIFESITETNGFRIRQLNNINAISSVPKCATQALTTFLGETEIELTPHSCVSQVLNALLVVSCPLRDEEKMQLLSVVKKCCPIDYIYSFSQRKCIVNTNKMFDFYNILFDHPVVIMDGPLDCPKSRVLVEYTLTSSDIMFSGGHLHIKKLNMKFQIGEYCIEAIREHEVNADFLASKNLKFLVRICTDYKICDGMPCIRRCCVDGEIFSKGNATSYCQKDNSEVSFHSFESLMISGNFSKPSVFGILRSLDCRKFRLDPDSYPDEAHTISDRDGSLYIITTQRNYTNNQYCVEKIRNSSWEDQKLYTFLCFDTKVVGNDKIRFKLYPIGVLISCLFYALTLAVYLSIPKLRNLPGKILICLVSSLCAAYLSIALGQLMPTSNDDICFASGFFVYFCLMAAFAWMNVMCFDIWQTFGTAKNKHGFKSDQTKRFVIYSIYGWGLPTFLTVTTVSLTKSDLLSESIKPHFGHGRCWFAYDTLASANLLFFSGPVGLLFLINFVLFSITLRYCNKVKREIFRMQSSNMEKPALRKRFFMDKARFAMNTKLFIVMGITWLLEILSILFYDHKKTFFWAISDSFNVLLGVFVFFIFVFKKRVWYAILERFGLKSRNNFKNAPTATFATHSTYAQSASMTRLNAIESNSILLSPITAAQRSPSRSPSM